MKEIFKQIIINLQREEDFEELHKRDFTPAFMSRGKIVKKSKEIWNQKGEKIQKNKNFLFLLETRNEKNNEQVFQKKTFEEEIEIHLLVFQDDMYSGVEKIIKVKKNINSKELYALVLKYHYKLFKNC